ncbi:hypothetical protein TNIN_257591, partial [Trichonephila inaurata madagascariensis]
LRGLLSKKISILQSKVFETITADSKVEHSSERISKKIGGNKKDEGILQNQLLTKGSEENDASENKGNSFQSQSNTVGDQETKAGPSHESKSNLETEDSSNLRGSLSKKISILQSKEFETITADSKVEHSSERTSKKIGGNKKDEGILQNQLLTKGSEENDASENKGNSFQSQSNTVGDQETKAGPSHESKSNLETEDSSSE